MAEQLTLQIEPRSRAGSRAARSERRHGRIPAVLYGHGEEPQAISIDLAEFRHRVKPAHYGSAIVQLRQGEADAGLAVVKSVQADPLKSDIKSVDLQRVTTSERLQVSVSIVLHGEPAGVRRGGVLEQAMHSVNIRCRTSEMPEQLNYNVEPLQVGDVIHAGQLALPPDAELLDSPDEVVAVILAPTVPVEEEPVIVQPDVAGPDLTEEKQKEDFPSER